MIALYLLAAHMVGDFVLSNRWQADLKFTDRGYRTRHVIGYCVAFVPIALAYGSSGYRGSAFLGSLFVLHWLTDSRRFRSTLGDVCSWWSQSRAARRQYREIDTEPVDVTDKMILWPPPNPWPPMPLLIDQTLHVVQIAVLAGIFLS